MPEIRRAGLVAPSSPPADLADVDRGISFLRKRGIEIERYRERYSPNGYLAGSDNDRIAELNHFLRSTEIDAIFCVRGGYGALRILDSLDYDAARNSPKLLIGYSDITALQLALLSRSGLSSVSGPMVAVEFAGKHANEQSAFWDLLAASVPYQIDSPDGSLLSPLVNGRCEGQLVGGNLAVMTRLLGTRYMPDLSGAILFIEDVGESPYQIDGMLAQLKLSGTLDLLGGALIGGFTDSEPHPGKPTLTIEDVIDDYFGDLSIPVATGLSYGHFPVKNALPVGVQARLEVNNDSTSLTLLESVWPRLS